MEFFPDLCYTRKNIRVEVMLSLNNVSYSIAGRQILDCVSFQVTEKHRIGLVGRNGSGKSTLFKLILGELDTDTGEVQRESGKLILAIRQDIPTGEMTPREFMLLQDRRRTDLMQKLEEYSETRPELVSDVYDQLISINAFDAEARAAIVLKGLGFDEDQQNRPLNSFSGGFRMRIALGAILFQEPDLLLLDEPTNHLDLETSDWLIDFLKSYPKSFVLISHDRDFLNSTVNEIYHLKNKTVSRYSGDFDTFLDTYALKQKNAQEYNAKVEAKRKHMMSFVEKLGAKATKAKQAQSRLKMISKLKFLPIDQDDPTVAFNFPEPNPVLSSNILTFDKVHLGYGDKTVLKHISGTIMSDDRIAIVGANGNGKTTLARFLSGELKQKKGTRGANSKLKIGFYRQDIIENLDLQTSLILYISSIAPNLNEQQIRTHLGRFGFSNDKVFQTIKDLSGGERARLVFAGLTTDAPNMLILDEPTNNLDLEMRESLISAINDYNGAVILITHDRHFLNRVVNSIYVISDGQLTHYTGDVSQYERTVLSSRK